MLCGVDNMRHMSGGSVELWLWSMEFSVRHFLGAWCGEREESSKEEVRDTYRKCKLVMDTRHDNPTLNVGVRGTIAALSLSLSLPSLNTDHHGACGVRPSRGVMSLS